MRVLPPANVRICRVVVAGTGPYSCLEGYLVAGVGVIEPQGEQIQVAEVEIKGDEQLLGDPQSFQEQPVSRRRPGLSGVVPGPARRGQAAGTPARTIRMPPVSSIWIPGRRWAPAPDHPAGPNPAGGRARERRGGAGRRGCPDRPFSYSGITLSDEGGLKRTHADPPLCVAARSSPSST